MTAEGFRRVVAESGAGGADAAYLYDSPGDDVFTGTADYGLMDFESLDDFYVKAWWFAVGQAIAEDHGEPDNDTAILEPGTAWDAVGYWEN